MAFLDETGLQKVKDALDYLYMRRGFGTDGDVGPQTDSEGKIISIPYFHVDADGRVTSHGVRSHVVKLVVSKPTISYSQSSTSVRTEVGNYDGRVYDTYTYTHRITVTRTTESGTTSWSCYGSTSSFTGSSAVIQTITNSSASSDLSYTATATTVEDGASSEQAMLNAAVPHQTTTCVCSCGCDCRCSCRST